jgi:hypothetical protein
VGEWGSGRGRRRRREARCAPRAPTHPPTHPPTSPAHPPPHPRIDNPKYKGIWVAPDIDNPEFKPDPNLHLIKDSKYVGFELWQVKAGSIFDNIMVTDDFAAAKKFAEDTWGKTKDAEKAMMVGGWGRGVASGRWGRVLGRARARCARCPRCAPRRRFVRALGVAGGPGRRSPRPPRPPPPPAARRPQEKIKKVRG